LKVDENTECWICHRKTMELVDTVSKYFMVDIREDAKLKEKEPDNPLLFGYEDVFIIVPHSADLEVPVCQMCVWLLSHFADEQIGISDIWDKLRGYVEKRLCSCGKDLSLFPKDIKKCPYCGTDITVPKSEQKKPKVRFRYWKKYTEEEDQEILDLYRAGKSNKEIGKIMGRDTKAIRARLNFLLGKGKRTSI